MIYFHEQNKIFHLKSKNTSYIFGFLKDKFLVHLYWGKSINDESLDFSLFIFNLKVI